MKHYLFVSLSVFAISFVGCSRDKLESDRDQQSYTIGFRLGQQLAPVKSEIDLDIVARGLKDGVNSKSKLEESIMNRQLGALQQKQRKSDDHVAGENLQKSTEFMDRVTKEAGVKILEAGVVVKVVKAGTERSKPLRDDDEITLRLRGKLIDGSVFDEASATNGIRVKFKDLQLPGMKVAVQKMPLGAEWVVYLAPNQAYGDGARPGVPRQSALTYEITLISIHPKK